MTEEILLNHLKKSPFLLAPMAGITELTFRTLMRRLGSGPVISELVSANGLRFSNEKTKLLMRISEEERPVGIQMFGESKEPLADAAQYVENLGANFVDLNLGCPVKKVVSKGAGSAMLKNPVELGKILEAMKSKISIPLTIKIRTGWDHDTKNADEIAKVAYNSGVTWVAIHGRTRSQAYKGHADWDYIAKVKANSPLPIIGNGDITTPYLANKRLKESLCDGVMIGRGCLKNPWIFQQATEILNQEVSKEREKNYLKILMDLFENYSIHHDEKFVVIQMRKLSSWFSSGHRGSSQFRRDIYGSKSLKDTMNVIDCYFSNLQNEIPEDTSHEKFLMGGHG